MAANNNLDSNKKIIEIEEQIEGDIVSKNDYFFCKVGESIALMSDKSPFDADDPPSNPLVFSRSHGLIFAAHSSGFCVAKVKDVVAAVKENQDERSDSSIQELSVVDVHIGRVSILALSMDSSYVAAVVGGEIQCFSVESLLNKAYEPSFYCSVGSNHVKDMFWIKETESSFIVLTYDGTLHLGSLSKSLKHVMDGVDAVGRSVEGNQIAVGVKNKLSIFSSKFEEVLQVLLPMDIWTGESDNIRVDSIRWVRSDSIVVGFFQQNEDDTEENYFLQIIMNKQGHIIDDSAKLTSMDFSDIIADIVDDIVPAGCGPHLFVNYMENRGFAFVSNRKKVDQHIMLFDWEQEDKLVSAIDFERNDWLPTIEVQESGDDNLIFGLCVDDSSVYENVKVKSGVEEEKELPAHCLLMCLTLEGRLIMFYVACITGTQRSTQALSSASSNAQCISVIGHSDIGGADLQLEEERAKHSSSDLKFYELEAKNNSSALDEVPSEKDQTQSEQSNNTLGIFKFDQNIRPELIAGSKNQQAVADVNNSKPFGRLGQSEEGGMSVAVDSFGTEKRNIEHGLSMTNKFFDKNLTSIGRDVEQKNKFGDLNSTPTTTTSGTSLGSSGLSNAQSLFTSPTFAKSTLSGSHLVPKDMASSSGSVFGNLGSRPTVSSSSTTGNALDYNKKSVTSSGLSGPPLSTPSSQVHLQESGKLLNFTAQSMQPMLGNEKKSSPLHSEQNLSKQFSNVQNMANELDKLLQSIEEEGGFRDVCTAAHRTSLEVLEEGMDSLSERNRVWQSCTEERHREIQLLLDKTVQVLARKTHMEGIVRQTTDGQYWDLWNRQKLNSELEQKRLNVYNRSQDLINRMIELEKHFNTLELNLYGESSGAHLDPRALNSRSAPLRHNQSLHAVHNATISQLAAAKQLSDSLSKQMTLLSIKSPPTKRATVKKQVFESIGIPYPDDSLCSPNTVKVMESPSNRRPSVSHSGGARTDSKRIHLSGVSSHDLETARRRRDSLDRNWANFEAPKTTVKRMVVQNERQNAGSLFSSIDKHFVSPSKLERPISNQSKFLAAQDRSGSMDMPPKLNSDATATSKYKWAGGIPELPETVNEQPHKWQILQGDSFPVTQNRSSSSSSSPLSTTFVDLNIKKGNILSTAERPGSQVGNIDKSNRSGTASIETKPSGLQFAEQNSIAQKIQPQIFSFPFGGQAPISENKETELTKPAVGQSFSDASTSKQSVEASTSSVFPPFSSSSLPSLSWPSSSITSGDSGSTSSTQIAKDVNKEVLQIPSSTISVPSSSAESMISLTSTESKEVLRFPTSVSAVSAPQPAPVISPSSKGTESVDSDSTKSFVNAAKEPLKLSPEATANKESSGDKLVATQSAENLASSSDGLNLSHLVPPSSSSVEVQKAFASSPDINKSAMHVNSIVSNAPEKQAAPINSFLAFPSELGGATGGKSNVENTLTQEDEMEEEAPETNQTAQTSLGTFAGFGIGSTPPSATAPKNNPFGGPIASAPQTMSSSISLTVPSGELFRPASFSFQSLQASQPSQPANIGAPSAFGFANSPQISSGSGFGQPSQIGFGQQALGSVLGSFGQSRQLGSGLPGSGFGVPQSPGGGFVNAPTGGFATAAAGGGFAAAATGASGFAAAAPSGGGFAAAATGGSGFAAAAPSGGGFAAAAGGAGGFGAFGNTGTSGFAGFGGSPGGRQAPSELFTQMRK